VNDFFNWIIRHGNKKSTDAFMPSAVLYLTVNYETAPSLSSYLPKFSYALRSDFLMDLMQHPHIAERVHEHGIRHTEIFDLCYTLHFSTTRIQRFLVCALYVRHSNIEPDGIWMIWI